jgi:hypothetical protein
MSRIGQLSILRALAASVIVAAWAMPLHAAADSNQTADTNSRNTVMEKGHLSRQIRTEIEINASAERVWSVLSNFPEYPNWNPFIGNISGTPEEGQRLEVSFLPSGWFSTFRPVVLVAQPAREFRWRGSLPIPGLFTGEHHFVIEPLAPGRVRFVHGEDFSGLLLPFASGLLDRTRHGFEAMNIALKKRAETP